MRRARRRWGGQAEAKLIMARARIVEADQRWQGMREYLERSGLGSDPKLIQQLAARAERRPGRGADGHAPN